MRTDHPLKFAEVRSKVFHSAQLGTLSNAL